MTGSTKSDFNMPNPPVPPANIPQPAKKVGKGGQHNHPRRKDWIRQRIEDKQQASQLGDLLGGLGLDDTTNRGPDVMDTIPSSRKPPTGPAAWRRHAEKHKQPFPVKSAFRKDAEQEWRELRITREREQQAAAAARKGLSLEGYLKQKEEKIANRAAQKQGKQLRFPEKQAKKQSKRAARRQEKERMKNLDRANRDGGAQKRTDNVDHGMVSGLAGASIKLAPMGNVNFGDAPL